MSALVVVAPTDAQLAYIAGLCEERGLEPSAAVYSKDDASECIAAILRRQYATRATTRPRICGRARASRRTNGTTTMFPSDSEQDCAANPRRDGGQAGKPANGYGVRAARLGPPRPSTTPVEARPPITDDRTPVDDRWREDDEPPDAERYRLWLGAPESPQDAEVRP